VFNDGQGDGTSDMVRKTGDWPKEKPAHLRGFPGAEDGIRTRDLLLGKEMLYQLSHFRSSRIRILSGPWHVNEI
jgi:hypothetical protein